MKIIDVQEQPILPFVRIVHIAITGVKYRLFRAIVTVAVIAVAMAFLMNILTESLIKKAVAVSARQRITALRSTDKWIAKLSVPQSYEELIFTLNKDNPFSTDQTLFLSGTSEKQALAFANIAKESTIYLDFFNNLNYGRRRVLVGSATSTDIFDELQPASKKTSLFESLENMKSVRFPTEPEPFLRFLSQWTHLRTYLDQVRSNQQEAIATIQAARGDRPMLIAMQDASGTFGNTIRKAGFDLTQDEAIALVDQSEKVQDNAIIEDTINHPNIRQAVAARFDVLPGDITLNMIWNLLKNQEGAIWYLDNMKKVSIEIPKRLTPQRVVLLAEARAETKLLIKAELSTVDADGGIMGIGTRMTWLAFVSMLVCVVGIANAMLMSVTERFREIATLKCLGALDGFIMTVFLIEASILGFVGGFVGTLIGLIICLLRMTTIFHRLVWEALPLSPLLVAALISIMSGIILAGFAAVYPSFRAARLAPMEAMRIE